MPGRRLGFIVSKTDGHLMRASAAAVSARQIVPVIDTVVPLKHIRQAHERVERGHVHGTVVVRIA